MISLSLSLSVCFLLCIETFGALNWDALHDSYVGFLENASKDGKVHLQYKYMNTH